MHSLSSRPNRPPTPSLLVPPGSRRSAFLGQLRRRVTSPLTPLLEGLVSEDPEVIGRRMRTVGEDGMWLAQVAASGQLLLFSSGRRFTCRHDLLGASCLPLRRLPYVSPRGSLMVTSNGGGAKKHAHMSRKEVTAYKRTAGCYSYSLLLTSPHLSTSLHTLACIHSHFNTRAHLKATSQQQHKQYHGTGRPTICQYRASPVACPLPLTR